MDYEAQKLGAIRVIHGLTFPPDESQTHCAVRLLKGAAFPIIEQDLTIGRAADHQICLDDEIVD